MKGDGSIRSGTGAGPLAMALVLLLGGGWGLGRVVEPAWAEVRATLSATPAGGGGGEATDRLIGGLLGGFRGLAANLAWLRLQGAWERSEPAHVEVWTRLAVRLDPRPVFFWIHGARMLAYDVPVWRLQQAAREGGGPVPEAVARTIQREQGERALALLAAGREVHPTDPYLAAETALVYLHRLDDLDQAAIWYRRAAELPGAPGYAGRLHGELLRRLGRPAEALAWYESWLPTLDPADPWSGAEVVAARIAELRAELGREE